MSTDSQEEQPKGFPGETRTVALLLVRMGDPGEGAAVGRPLTERFRFMSRAASVVSKHDGIVAHGMADTMVAYFEGGAACARALAAAVVILDEGAAERAADATFPAAAVGLDVGAVCFLRYGEGLPPDPQGETVDRCRRLAQAAPIGAALATNLFREKLSARDDWKALPIVPMPGLEGQRLYQLKARGETFRWKPTIVVEADRIDRLQDRLDDSEYRLSRKDEQIARLEQLMREITGDIDATTGEFTRVLTDPKTEELRRLVGDLRRAELAAWVPLLAGGAAGYRAKLKAEERLAKLAAELQERYPEHDWTDVDFWARLLVIPTTEPET
jgi:hypothetical protein